MSVDVEAFFFGGNMKKRKETFFRNDVDDDDVALLKCSTFFLDEKECWLGGSFGEVFFVVLKNIKLEIFEVLCENFSEFMLHLRLGSTCFEIEVEIYFCQK